MLAAAMATEAMKTEAMTTEAMAMKTTAMKTTMRKVKTTVRRVRRGGILELVCGWRCNSAIQIAI